MNPINNSPTQKTETTVDNNANVTQKNKHSIVSFFKSKFNTIKNIFSRTKYIINTKDQQQPIPIEKKVHKLVPEGGNSLENIDPNNVKELVHKERQNPEDANIKTKPHYKKYKLGKGSYGEVNLAADSKRTVSPLLVVKRFTNSQTAAIDSAMEQENNLKFGTPSLLNKKNNSIISKYEGESLASLISHSYSRDRNRKAKDLSTKVKRNICYQLLKNVHSLHQQGILHQDIKPANILVNANGKLKLIDFGGAQQKNIKTQGSKEEYDRVVFSPAYAPPEVHKEHKKFQKTFDSWSVGATIYELYTGKPLVSSANMIRNGSEYFMSRVENKIQAIKNSVPEEIYQLISSLLKENPEDRLSIEQAFNQLDNKDILLTEMSDVGLNLKHAEHLEKLAALEESLEKAQDADDLSEVTELNSKINKQKFILNQLQNEIKKRT